MANEPRGAWARPRPSASRTPQQSRSSNASPAPATSTTAPAAAKPAATPAAPAGNVWAQRAAAQKPSPAVTTKAAKKEQSTPAAAAAAATPATQEKHVPVNNFNYGEVKQMMGQKEARSVYKVDTSASASDPACMANGKNFWAHLEEQVAAARQKDGEKQ